MTFEEKMNKLEIITQKIEDRKITLDEAIHAFDEGITLSTQLEKELREIENKIEIMTNKPDISSDEKPEFELFD